MYKTLGKVLVYVDESGFEDDMPRLYGYSVRGKRCVGTNDWNARKRTNVIGASLGKILLTVALFTVTINTAVFLAWIEKELICKLPKNSVVIMDNASFHKSTKIKEALEMRGHILEYLPPYSPDLNPIEPKWAQSKKLRRKQQCSLDDLFKNNVATL